MSAESNVQLRVSSGNQDPPYQAGKWLSLQALIDGQEMAALLNTLGNPYIFLVSGAQPRGSSAYPRQKFIEEYGAYIETLKSGQLPSDALVRTLFAALWTLSPDHVYAVHVGEDKQLIRICKPVIQLQPHSMDYSPYDQKFRSMMFGQESISWGIQFSYPQMFQDPATHEVVKPNDVAKFPNTGLFQTLQRWMRNNSSATPFLMDGKKINVPMRLGKNCFAWINNHPQLVNKGLKVALPNPGGGE